MLAHFGGNSILPGTEKFHVTKYSFWSLDDCLAFIFIWSVRLKYKHSTQSYLRRLESIRKPRFTILCDAREKNAQELTLQDVSDTAA